MADQAHPSVPATNGASEAASATTTNATSNTPCTTIPQRQQHDEILNASRESVVSPTQKKTGTRSTFCTRIKPCTRAEEKKEEVTRSPGFLEMLGVRQQANYGDTVAKDDEPIQHSYY